VRAGVAARISVHLAEEHDRAAVLALSRWTGPGDEADILRQTARAAPYEPRHMADTVRRPTSPCMW
jgi:hypothetical protein